MIKVRSVADPMKEQIIISDKGNRVSFGRHPDFVAVTLIPVGNAEFIVALSSNKCLSVKEFPLDSDIQDVSCCPARTGGLDVVWRAGAIAFHSIVFNSRPVARGAY